MGVSYDALQIMMFMAGVFLVMYFKMFFPVLFMECLFVAQGVIRALQSWWCYLGVTHEVL
jgi:hypothetical protein